MSKLHQLLAVNGDLKGHYDKILAEGRKTFAERSGHFEGHSKTYEPLNQEDTDIPPNDIKHIVENVPSKLNYMQGAIVKHLDALLQTESTNANAKADLIVEDEKGNKLTLGTNIPATALLNFETKLKEIRAVYEAAPTYDPSKKWTKDAGEANVYVSEPVKTVRTRKTEEALVLIQPTKEHPGQAKSITVDRNAGTWINVYKSGALSPADKSRLLGRIDLLIQATKKARQIANDQEVVVATIGKEIFAFIHG